MKVHGHKFMDAKETSSPTCYITIKDGIQTLVMPNGDHIPAQIWSRVYNGVDEPSYAIVKLFVRIRPLDQIPNE